MQNDSETEKYSDKIRGSLFGDAVGDALGYPVEFLDEEAIFSRCGAKGIREYELDPKSKIDGHLPFPVGGGCQNRH